MDYSIVYNWYTQNSIVSFRIKLENHGRKNWVTIKECPALKIQMHNYEGDATSKETNAYCFNMTYSVVL